MMQARRSWIVTIVAVAISILALVAVLLVRPRKSGGREFVVPAKPAAPPDLEKLRPVFNAGLDALSRKDGAEAPARISRRAA